MCNVVCVIYLLNQIDNQQMQRKHTIISKSNNFMRKYIETGSTFPDIEFQICFQTATHLLSQAILLTKSSIKIGKNKNDENCVLSWIIS